MDFSKTDIVVVSLPDQDFPLFRKFLIDNHRLFNKIHYVFSYQPNQLEAKYDYSKTIMDSMPFANFIWADHNEITTWRKDGLPSDFRDHATNKALDQSNSESVLFLEPDIIVGNIDCLLKLPDALDIIAHCEDTSYRLSPSFIWTRRKLIDKTRRWFTASGQFIFDNIVQFTSGPDVLVMRPTYGEYVTNTIPIKDRFFVHKDKQATDHFNQFTSELILQSINAHFINHRSFDFRHMGGVVATMWHFRKDIYEGVYELDVLGRYMEQCLKCDIPLDPKYVEEIKHHLQNMRKFANW